MCLLYYTNPGGKGAFTWNEMRPSEIVQRSSPDGSYCSSALLT